MFAQRALALTLRRAAPRPSASFTFTPAIRSFASSAVVWSSGISSVEKYKNLTEVKSEEDLLPPGAAPGAVPTDLEQATGLERLELLGKMEGVDIFDMKPLDASRTGTLDDPIVVQSYGTEQYLGCTGYPADSHITIWLTVSKDRPFERCPECGSVYKMDYLGAEASHHDHDHGEYQEPKTMADFVKPNYW